MSSLRAFFGSADAVVGEIRHSPNANKSAMRFLLGELLLFTSLLTNVPAQTPGAGELTRDLQQAQTALKAGDQAAAAAAFHAAVKLDPGNAEAHLNLGVIAFFHGDCAAALPELQSAVTSAPSMNNPRALIAVCERRMGAPAAQADLEQAFGLVQEAKLRTQVGIELADLYYQTGNLPRTASVLETLSTVSPDNIDILFFEQRVYSELADGTLNKLALLAPGSARMEQLIAEKLVNGGDLKGAIVHYQQALQLNPNLPGMHFELAESLMETSPNDAEVQKQALGQLDAAVKIDGDSPKVETERGRIAFLQGDSEAAIGHYQRALELNPVDSQAELGLAELLQGQEKPEEAARYLRMAVSSDPLNAEAHYKLSQVARQLHHEEEQKQELKLFLEIRATKEKIKALYRQMNPQPVAPGESNSR